jgi:hypothetical protein
MIDINPFIVLFTIFISFLILYIISPTPKIIIKYPDISENMSCVYYDEHKVPYRYHRIQVQ